MTLMELKSSYNDSTSTTAVLDIWIRNELDSQHYDIDMVSTNLFVEFLTVDILFLDPVFMTNNLKAQKMKKLNWMQQTSVDSTLLIYSDPTLPIFNENHFIGLTTFKMVNNYLIYDCQINNG